MSGNQQGRAIAGPGASARKYDILTALTMLALNEGGEPARLALRLSVLITARYNWQIDELSIGQREIARLWGVDERTVKRDTARLRQREWLTVKRPPAKGRVTVFGLGLPRIEAESRHLWPQVGPDYLARMEERNAPPVIPEHSKVVPLRPAGPRDLAAEEPDSIWGRAARRLEREDPVRHVSWFSRLALARHDGGEVLLTAPSAFIAGYIETHFGGLLLAALSAQDPAVRSLRITA